MFLLHCPWCGLRDELEFVCGGERAPRPDAAEVTDSQWADWLYVRSNSRGWIREHWVHRYGCGQWFIAVRHTASNEIFVTAPVGGPEPGLPP